MKPPTQPLPWSVRVDRTRIRGRLETSVTVLDANGFWVASFGPVRAEADFVIQIANEWHARQEKEPLDPDEWARWMDRKIVKRRSKG